MQSDDQTQEGSVDEQQNELELDNSVDESTDESSNPTVEELQAKLDAEVAEKLKYKAIVDRNRDKDTEETQEPSEFLSKKDFYKSNERKAINELTAVSESDPEDVKARKAYITENWDKISPLYTSRKGKDTPEDILEDLVDAVTLYVAKNPPKEDDGSGELSTTSGGGSGSTVPKTESKDELNIPQSAQPKDWYKLTPASEAKLKERGVL